MSWAGFGSHNPQSRESHDYLAQSSSYVPPQDTDTDFDAETSNPTPSPQLRRRDSLVELSSFDLEQAESQASSQAAQLGLSEQELEAEQRAEAARIAHELSDYAQPDSIPQYAEPSDGSVFGYDRDWEEFHESAKEPAVAEQTVGQESVDLARPSTTPVRPKAKLSATAGVKKASTRSSTRRAERQGRLKAANLQRVAGPQDTVTPGDPSSSTARSKGDIRSRDSLEFTLRIRGSEAPSK